MRLRLIPYLGCVMTMAALVAASTALAADWPAYRHDVRRSSVTEETLSFPLRQAWSYVSPQPPGPAWPDTYPQDILNRMDFDYAPALVIAGGLVVFGSSSDDTVRALDAQTGRERWHFIAGGPIRFAPQIVSNRIYVASDDGFLYCLDAGVGKPVWTFRAAPADERLIGNHRMISRWPIRTGVLVDGGVVYAVAGMWPAEGVFIYALQADTGQVLWCNDTVGGTPQGSLAATGDVLLVPNGNGGATPLDRRTGMPRSVSGANMPGVGGTWLTIDGDTFYTYAMHRSGVLSIAPFSLTSGPPARAWGVGVVPQLTIQAQPGPKQIHARGKVSAIVHAGRPYVRQAYGSALAGDALLLGHDGAVTAERTGTGTAPDQTKASELWRAPVDGEARELAVADGRLFVATSRGTIYAFESGKGVGGNQNSEVSSQKLEYGAAISDQSKIQNLKSRIARLLEQSGMDRGFALVLGDSDGQLAMALAEQTQLQVVVALTDAAAAGALRERLLAQTAWYGSRVHVQAVERLDRLPFARYFANAVIVAGASPVQGGPGAPRSASEAGLSGQELYRVLRPCGGVLLCPGLPETETERVIKESGAMTNEIRTGDLWEHRASPGTSDGGPASPPAGNGEDGPRGRGPSTGTIEGRRWIVRGKLPGALDWDTNPKDYTADQRVRWPLRTLWFGGPSARQVQEFVEKAAGPVLANGRSFTIGEDTLTAVDAYNGTVLWSRPIPKCYYYLRAVEGVLHRVSDPASKYGRAGRGDLTRALRTSDDYVYLMLGAGYFQGKGAGSIQMDARTGEQKKVSGPYLPPTNLSLKTPQTWPVDVDSNHSGTVGLENAGKGLIVTLTTRDPVITPLDAWELFFDFRPAGARYGLYERGTFHVRVTPARDPATPAAWRPLTGVDHPRLEVSGAREPDGTKTVVVLPWPDLENIVGAKPSDFGFAVALDAHDGGSNEPVARHYLFGDWTADGLNNGWASVSLGDPATGGTSAAPVSTNPPAIMTVVSTDARPGLVVGGRAVDGSVLAVPVVHPLTGEPVPKISEVPPGCGAAYYAAALISGRHYIYDLVDNSGMRVMGGVKTGCSTPQVSALGLMLVAEESGHCVCNYSFRTTLALAPADRRLNEDWATFYDRDVDTAVRQAHLNFGAPGDRRDQDGSLWLGFPRQNENKVPEDYPNADHPLSYPLGMRDAQVGLWYRRSLRPSVWVPLTVECAVAAPLPAAKKAENFGPYRFSGDRVVVRGTDRPWLYASGYRGLRKATLALNFLKPLASIPARAAVTVDGKLDEACWSEAQPSTNGVTPLLPYTGTRVAFRHDERNLYVGVQRPPMVYKSPRAHWTRELGSGTSAFKSETRAWQKGASKPDALSQKDNWWRLIVGATAGRQASGDVSPAGGKAVYLTLTPDGTRADALGDATTNGLDGAWSAPWQSAVVADTNGMTLEMAIPWTSLQAAGVSRDQLAVNCMMCDPGIGTEALTYLGIGGYDACSNFTPLGLEKPVTVPPRSFNVRLHFAEPDANAKPGRRVFDVKLQGQMVLKAFDIVKEAGAPRTALVKEFKGVKAAESLTLECVPAAPDPTPENAPILCALEVMEESYTSPAPSATATAWAVP